MITGENIGDSLKKNAAEAGNEVLNNIISKTADSLRKKSEEKAKPAKKYKKKSVKRSMNYIKLQKAPKIAKRDIFD